MNKASYCLTLRTTKSVGWFLTQSSLLSSGGRIFLGLWLRNGCGHLLANTLPRPVWPPLVSTLPPQNAPGLFSFHLTSNGLSFKSSNKILSLFPKTSLSKYPPSFHWYGLSCFMNLLNALYVFNSLKIDSVFKKLFRVQERNFRWSVFFPFFHSLSCVYLHLAHLVCVFWVPLLLGNMDLF